MNDDHMVCIADELKLAHRSVRGTAALLDEGATVPFIARYRKEATGALDEVAITSIRDRLAQLRELDKRREAILKSLDQQGKLTDELHAKVLAAETLAVLEDVYLPYRPKRRTRASIAVEKGLEPLAKALFEQDDIDPLAEAGAFVDPEKGVESADDAMAGARDIVAEWVNENEQARATLRELFASHATFRCKVIAGKEDEGKKYRDYFDCEESVTTAPSHRILAMRRGETESILALRVLPPEDEAIRILDGLFVTGHGAASKQVRMAVQDGYKRLLSMSMETEIRLATKQRADEQAIQVFAENLRELLLAPPLGQKSVLAIDPGFRTGCKVVCLDRQGKLLHHDTIYPHPPRQQTAQATDTITTLVARFQVEAIAIGNGTAGRETETFILALDLPKAILVVMVNESGASVYSASEVARQEFPDHDVTVRGAVSIGRRLTDPLAELVKIDPKSIGVGQYQHDVDQSALKRSLDDVVMSGVNAVGVEVNTASRELLTYVSGLGPQLAKNVVAHRDEHGPFRSRRQLRKVPRLGPKAFEQAAGFLRICGADHPLDASAVHPESYPIVDAMAKTVGCSVTDLMRDAQLRDRIDLKDYVTDKVGLPTLTDIVAELAKPGRDPREQFEVFRFADGVEKLGDLKPGMRLPGVVTNVVAFGAFVDIGVHQDGLVHISQLADRYVNQPADVVKVHQKVMVTVLDVDLDRQRISLSMKSGQSRPDTPAEPKTPSAAKPKGGGKPAQPKRPRQGTGRQQRSGHFPFADFFKDRPDLAK